MQSKMGRYIMGLNPAIIAVNLCPLKICILHMMPLRSIIILSKRYRAG
jgi:hypothetical protein